MRFCDLLIGTRLKHRDWTGRVWGLDPVLRIAIVETETEPSRRVGERELAECVEEEKARKP